MAGSTTDFRGRPVVAVTGIGVVSSIGADLEESWSALTAGRSGVRAISRFATDHMRTRIAGAVDDLWQEADTAMDLTMRAGLNAAS